MTFAEKLKELRNQKGLSQEQISKEMRIAISSLRNYENGRLPDTHQLKIIKNAVLSSSEILLSLVSKQVCPFNIKASSVKLFIEFINNS